MITAAGPVVTFGETMAIVRANDIGSLRHASAMTLGVGGAESNVAIGLRRLGTPVSWLGRVGDDSLGERVAREIRAEGVDVRAIVDDGASTGLIVKERPSAGSTAVHYYRAGSAGSRIAPEDLPGGWIEDAALVHVTGITAVLSESGRRTVESAIDRARSGGVPVSFDINYRSRLDPQRFAGPMLRRFAESADRVFGDPDELAVLFPDDDANAAVRHLLEAGVTEVVRKDGERGATVISAKETTHSPAFEITPVDTVGAGDAFVAGYLSASLSGASVADALVRANACGAMACLGTGDWEAAPTLRDLDRFLGGDATPVHR